MKTETLEQTKHTQERVTLRKPGPSAELPVVTRRLGVTSPTCIRLPSDPLSAAPRPANPQGSLSPPVVRLLPTLRGAVEP